jgi:hypothetical protein
MMMWVALGVALGYGVTSYAQTLTTPLPTGCMAKLNPNGVDWFISCTATPPIPPVCAPVPPVCPTQPPAGCAPCTPPGPTEPPPVSCGDLKQIDGGALTFDPQMTKDIRLGRGDKEVFIMHYTVQASDAGKKSSVNIVEHGSGAHYKTVWASRTKCLMDGSTMEGSNSSPSVFVSVNGTAAVNMAVGEKWYFMWRNLSSSGKNTCSDDGGCGERISAYLWQPSPAVMQRGGPLPKRDQPRKK